MPKSYKVGDKTEQLFTTGEISKIIGRSPQTLRRWERLRIIPASPFSLGERKFSGQGKRLFGGLHKEILKVALIKAGIKQGKPLDKVFTQMVAKGYEEVASGKYPSLLKEFQNGH